ncbi:MAG: hypothetical protein M8353_08850 [ANME-2 cluster archaeon]|nr:hypothetical protein [ANME-2 cluster archaeon]
MIGGYKGKEENIPNKVQDSATFLTPAKPGSSVTPAQEQLHVYPNSSESFEFWDQNIAISYLLSSPHLTEVTIDRDLEPEKQWFLATVNSNDLYFEAYFQDGPGKKKS